MLMQRAIGEFAIMAQSAGTPPDYAIQLDDEPIIDRVHLIISEQFDDPED